MSYPGKGVIDGEGAVVWFKKAGFDRVGPFSWNFSRLIQAGDREVSRDGLCVGENVDELAEL